MTLTAVTGANANSLAVEVVEVWTQVKSQSFKYLHYPVGDLCVVSAAKYEVDYFGDHSVKRPRIGMKRFILTYTLRYTGPFPIASGFPDAIGNASGTPDRTAQHQN